jgi:methionyl-tRNA formyltransferase
MNDKSGIILLGGGHEALHAAKILHKRGLLRAFGQDRNYLQSAQIVFEFCKSNFIPIVENHYDAINREPKIILLISYPPLINRTELEIANFINIHGALVPKYRGMHGGTWAIINGERLHGFSVHEVDNGIDDGPVYYQAAVEIEINENVNEIRKKIHQKFITVFEDVIMQIYNGELKPVQQNENEAIYVCKRRESDGIINWSESAFEVHNLIRALCPPYTKGAFTFYKGKKLYISKSIYCEKPKYKGIVGQVVSTYPDGSILVKCGDAALQITEIIFEDRIISPANIISKVGYRFENQ